VRIRRAERELERLTVRYMREAMGVDTFMRKAATLRRRIAALAAAIEIKRPDAH
jgi:hypothetical protein